MLATSTSFQNILFHCVNFEEISRPDQAAEDELDAV